MTKTRDHAALEKRRKKAGQLFAKEYSAPEVARRLGVARQVAYRWKNTWDQGGSPALASKGPAGPKGASGFSCQRPERRAVERDEKAIRRWSRTELPALKKRPTNKDEP